MPLLAASCLQTFVSVVTCSCSQFLRSSVCSANRRPIDSGSISTSRQPGNSSAMRGGGTESMSCAITSDVSALQLLKSAETCGCHCMGAHHCLCIRLCVRVPCEPPPVPSGSARASRRPSQQLVGVHLLQNGPAMYGSPRRTSHVLSAAHRNRSPRASGHVSVTASSQSRAGCACGRWRPMPRPPRRRR